MTAIAASNVTYTLLKTSKAENNEKCFLVKIAFGNAALTYPSGGIPLSAISGSGFPNYVRSVVFADSSNADGYLYKWDGVNNKIRIYQTDSASPPAPLVELGSVAVAATTVVCEVRGY
jgi:hypothetical protein